MLTRCGSVLLKLLPPLAFVLFLFALPRAYAPFIGAGAPSSAATFTHGVLSVAIPYHGARPGSGRLVAEIVDPEEHVLGRAERPVEIAEGDGSWQQSITPAKPIAFEDLVWQRVRYRFEYSDKAIPPITGVESISSILRRPVVRILGQTEFLAGSDAAVRILVSDAGNQDAALTGTVRAELLIPQQGSSLALLRAPQPPRYGRGSVSPSGRARRQIRYPLHRRHAHRFH